MHVMLIWHRRGAGAVHLSVKTSSSHIHLFCKLVWRWALTQQGKLADAQMQPPGMLWVLGRCLSTLQDCDQDAPVAGHSSELDRSVLTHVDYSHVVTACVLCESSVCK